MINALIRDREDFVKAYLIWVKSHRVNYKDHDTKNKLQAIWLANHFYDEFKSRSKNTERLFLGYIRYDYTNKIIPWFVSLDRNNCWYTLFWNFSRYNRLTLVDKDLGKFLPETSRNFLYLNKEDLLKEENLKV